MQRYKYLSAAAQAAFANVSTAALSAERSVADAPGGFVKKSVRGHDYWYHQIKLPNGRLQQTYVGKAGTEVDALMAAHADPAAKASQAHLQSLSRAAIALGNRAPPAKQAMVLSRLIDFGFFRAGGILIGTHCFMAYESMFGFAWEAGDFGKNVSLAFPHEPVDTHAAIESLKMGFAPNNAHTTYRKADEPDLELDFVTAVGREGDKPVFIKSLNVTMQPLKFMEFSMEGTTRAVLLSRSGPLVVTVPAPERYAVHKLLVYGERVAAQRTKANKDLSQAASLIAYLSEHDPDALQAAWRDLNSRGPGWRKRADMGLGALRRMHSDLDLGAMVAAGDGR